jgi:hypothetical protein
MMKHLLTGLLLLAGLAIGGSILSTPLGVSAQPPPGCFVRQLWVDDTGAHEYWRPFPCEDSSEELPTATLTPEEIPGTAQVVLTDTPLPTSTPMPPTATLGPATPTHTQPPTVTSQVTATPVVGAQTRIVPDQYASISAAITAASAGDTVLIRSGTYLEQATIPIGKDGLTLQGEPGAWIDGECLRENGIHVYGPSDVTVRGLGIKRTNGAGVKVERRTSSAQVHAPARTTITGNTIQDFNCDDQTQAQIQAGVSITYAGPGQIVTHNTIHRRVEVAGLQRGHGNGIHFQSDTSRPSGGGHLIADNAILGGYDGIGGATESSPRGAYDGHTLITRNLIRNCFDDGIQVEGGMINVTVSDNRIEECGVGVAFSNVRTGPLTITNNVIVSSSPRGDPLAADPDVLACYKLGNTAEAWVYLTGNHCTVNYPGDPSLPGTRRGDGLKQTNNGQAYYTLRDNVFRVSRYVVEMGNPRPGTSFDGDCMETSDPSRFWELGGTRLNGLAAVQSAGHEATGRSGPC